MNETTKIVCVGNDDGTTTITVIATVRVPPLPWNHQFIINV